MGKNRNNRWEGGVHAQRPSPFEQTSLTLPPPPPHPPNYKYTLEYSLIQIIHQLLDIFYLETLCFMCRKTSVAE